MTTVYLKNQQYREYPRAVYLHLTQQCNLDCVYCYINAGKHYCHDLGSDEVERLLCQIAAFRPSKLVFTGGEPLLRKDLLELALYFRKIRHASSQLCLDTNGTLINSSNASLLLKLFDEIRISLDGFEEVNDLLRGRGSFGSTLKGISNILDAGGMPSLALTLTSINLTSAEFFIHYMCREWGIRKMRINPVKPMGRAKARPDILLKNDPNDINYQNSSICDSNHPCDGDDSCLGATISINPQGLAFPCHWLSQKDYYIGNVRDEKLSLIYERLRKLSQQTITTGKEI